MLFPKLVVCAATLAMAAASAATKYDVTLFQPSVIGSSELKPGDYKLEVNGEKAVLKAGKNAVETTVKVENGSEKFAHTVVTYGTEGGKNRVHEIRVGGTKTTLIFSEEPSTN
jgi:hypothetical protein